MSLSRNLDERTVRGFGEEWSSYDQRRLPQDEVSVVLPNISR
jgi:hypothetical protein